MITVVVIATITAVAIVLVRVMVMAMVRDAVNLILHAGYGLADVLVELEHMGDR